jgi:predicted RNA binding protein YcfA (HicA-like mRNA interferase family)
METIKRLKKAGFIATRQRGSHVRLEKSEGDKIIKLTVPLHSEMKKGTLNRIIKEAGMTLEEFESLN